MKSLNFSTPFQYNANVSVRDIMILTQNIACMHEFSDKHVNVAFGGVRDIGEPTMVKVNIYVQVNTELVAGNVSEFWQFENYRSKESGCMNIGWKKVTRETFHQMANVYAY